MEGMPGIKQLVEFIEGEVYAHLDRSIEGLTDGELNWDPSEHSNPIGVLLTHISGAESYWIHKIVGGIEVERVRAEEFLPKVNSTPEVMERIQEVREVTRTVLSELENSNLSQPRSFWSNSQERELETTVHWAIMHFIEHTALHVGQIFYARKLYADTMKE
jgi:uncharacterized damage-inducible protein DinB